MHLNMAKYILIIWFIYIKILSKHNNLGSIENAIEIQVSKMLLRYTVI